MAILSGRGSGRSEEGFNYTGIDLHVKHKVGFNAARNLLFGYPLSSTK